MFLHPRMDLFKFEFTRDTVPLELQNKYQVYLDNFGGIGFIIKDTFTLMNYGIQGFDLPGLSYDPVTQLGLYGKNRLHRNSTHPNELYAKDFTVTVRMLDGFINYLFFRDLFEYYYSESKKTMFLPDQKIKILNGEGFVIIEILLERILFNGISGLTLSSSTNTPDFTTFELNLTYNQMSLNTMFK